MSRWFDGRYVKQALDSECAQVGPRRLCRHRPSFACHAPAFWGAPLRDGQTAFRAGAHHVALHWPRRPLTLPPAPCVAACIARPAPHGPRADSSPWRRYTRALIVALVKPMLFVSKVPMVNGTIFLVAIIFGGIVSFSAMLSSFGPSPSRTASAATAPSLAVPPSRHGRAEVPARCCLMPLVRLARCIWPRAVGMVVRAS